MDLDKVIRKVKDFPKPGILFYDVTSIFTDPAAFRFVINQMLKTYLKEKIDGVIAIESRGFLVGSCFALERKLPLVLARKKGKLPGRTIAESYSLEYGQATLEIQCEDLPANRRWLIVDDLIATGGTLAAVARMVERQGSKVEGIFGIIGLPFLKYEEKIGAYNPRTLIEYDTE
jgi:adenine phosphoribosyltransferase